MDVHVPQAISTALRSRGVDLITAQEDGYRRESDILILERCTELHRVLFTQDRDFIEIINHFTFSNQSFAGVFFAYSKKNLTAAIIDDLQIIAEVTEWEDWLNRFEVIPL
jgi:predicted nuclease of predicted toxin-antitoxin system